MVLDAVAEPAASGKKLLQNSLCEKVSFQLMTRGLRICLPTSAEEDILRAKTMEKGCGQPVT